MKGADIADLKSYPVSFHVYSLDETGPNLENDEDSEGKDVNLATHWILPSSEFFNLWENLFYEQNVKERVSVVKVFFQNFLIISFSAFKICIDYNEIR